MHYAKLVTCIALFVFFTGQTQAAEVITNSGLPPDNDIRRILAERIDFYERGVGIVVGVIDVNGRRIISHGYADRDRAQPVTADTIFELGSVTKVFTALLLADMVRRGEVKLNDPVSKFLPKSVPDRPGREISLKDLATYTFGLSWSLAGPTERNSYGLADNRFTHPADFSAALRWPDNLTRRYRDADIGYGVLGYALARRKKSNYAQLLTERILNPLGLDNTATSMIPKIADRVAQGHGATLEPIAASQQSDLFIASDGLRSTANDMLTFLSAMLGQRKTALSPAMRDMLAIRRATWDADTLAGMGWAILQADGQEIVWVSGNQAGFSTWIGFDTVSQTAAVVLANTGLDLTDDIGFHVLNPRFPLKKLKKRIAVDGARLQTYVGRYRLADGQIITIRRDQEHLTLALDGTSPMVAYPASDRSFFTPAFGMDFTFDFEREDQVRPKRVVFYRDTMPEIAERLE